MLSIDGQLHELRAFAARTGIAVSQELTEAYSARDPGRPVFSKLLTEVYAGRVRRILSWKLDRLARNPVDGGALIHALGKGSLAEIVTPEGTYTGTGDSKFMLAVHFGVATKMVDDLSAGVRRGSHDVCRQGRIPGAPPLGYIKVRDRQGIRGAGKIEPDPERFPLVRRLWLDMVSGQFTITEAWRRAVENGLTSRPTFNRAAEPIKLTLVFHLLRSRFYTGVIPYDGEIYPGEHPAMVTTAQFEEVQKHFGRTDVPRPSKNQFLFRGLLHCGECGGERLMVGEAHKTTAGNRFVYYRCGRRRPAYPICHSKPVAESVLFTAAESALSSLAIAPELARWTLGAVDWWIENRTDERASRISAVKRQIKEHEAKLLRLTDLLVAGTLDEAEYRTRKEALQVELHELRERIDDPGRDDDAWRNAVKEILDAGSLCASVDALDPEARRALVARLYANVEVVGGIPRFSLRFPYLVLKDAPVVHAGVPKSYANFPKPEDCCIQTKKAARRSRLVTAFSIWCTQLLRLRTALPGFPDAAIQS